VRGESLYLSAYSYLDGASGVVRADFDEETGELAVTGRVSLSMPDWISPEGQSLFVAHATRPLSATPANIQERIDAAAFSVAMISKRDFSLSCELPLFVHNTCHILSSRGWLFAADYAAGEICAQMGETGRVIKHEGKGPNAERQEAAHPHSVYLTPDGKYLAVCDLGIDAVLMYPFDRKSGLGEPIRLDCPPGSGPRHIAFTDKHMYIVCELSNQILRRALTEGFPLVDVKSTLPKGYAGKSFAAAIHLSPDGRRLGASNRGHDSVALFDILPGGGLAEPIFVETVKTPREFAFSPSGRWIIGGSQTEGVITATPARAGGRAKPILPVRSACMIFA
jgi:6-phosphogluconolactonase